MARDPYKYFRVEARELLDQLNRAALDLERATTPEGLAQLLRLAHTLKGAARVVKRTDIGDHAHAIEDTLAPLRDSGGQATQTQIDTVLRLLDEINVCLAALSTPAETQPERESAAPVATEEVQRTVRVDIGEMDNLLDGLIEVHAQLGGMRDSLQRAGNIRGLTDLLGAQFATQRDRRADKRGGLDDAQSTILTEQIAGSFEQLNRGVMSGIEQLDRELKLVRDAAERMRLIPADSLFIALERAARDAAQVHQKQVRFAGHGGEVRLDAQVLGAMQGALAHAVRNAVAHGIETPAARQAAGKPPAGCVTVGAAQRGRWIVFICSDDGSGVDLKTVRRVAEQKGLLAAGARADSEALLKLLLKGGISTTEKVTEVAGRGVGLDAVRDAVERLDGSVDLATEAGHGTTLTLTVPLSIAALDGLQVESSGVAVTIPLESVRATLRVTPDRIAHTAQGATLLHDGRTLPFLPLAQALSLTTAYKPGTQTWSAVVVESDGGAVAIGVERLIGVASIISRPLPTMAPAASIVAGVSVDIEGNPQLVLDPAGLVAAAQHAGATRPDRVEAATTILVIDDSLTTRMLERSILESAGYAVELAVSAEEAMEKAKRNRYALFLVDVEMPGMDGFTFIEQTRLDPDLRDIPAILVTSLASPEHLQRGRDVGARGHIVKSEFDQGVLLARIEELVR